MQSFNRECSHPSHSQMLLYGLFFFLIAQFSVFVSCSTNIKMVIFRTGNETPEQIAMLPRIEAAAALYGANPVEQHSLPAGPTY